MNTPLVRPADDLPYGDPVPSGRQLDALVERDVMGIVWDKSRCRVCGWPLVSEGHPMGCTPNSCSLRPRPKRRADEPAPYSTDIATAWLVVAMLKDAATSWTLANYGNEWHVKVKRIDEYGKKVFYGESAEQELPLAICRAAITAVSAPAEPCR